MKLQIDHENSRYLSVYGNTSLVAKQFYGTVARTEKDIPANLMHVLLTYWVRTDHRIIVYCHEVKL